MILIDKKEKDLLNRKIDDSFKKIVVTKDIVLPHYDEYDGIIFDCTNMTDQDQLELIIEKLKNLDIPVVSIGYYVDGLYYVGNDNKKLFRFRRKICCTQNREYRACERSNSAGNKA